MAATRKLQGEEKVLPACLHLDIAVPVPRRGIGLDGRPGRLGRRRAVSFVDAGLPRFCGRRARASRADSRLGANGTVPGTRYIARPMQRRSPNGYDGFTARRTRLRPKPVDIDPFVSFVPCDRGGSSTVEDGDFLFCRHNL